MARWAYALLLIAGCSSPGSECIGNARALDDCAQGIAWADCGGTGNEPRFACNAIGDCRWFTNDCVAQGYEASSCPASDLCCHADYPYPDSSLGSPRAMGIGLVTEGWGTEAWDATRERTLSVTVGATAAGVRPFIDCAHATTLFTGSACDQGISAMSSSFSERGGIVMGFVSGGVPSFGGHSIGIELIPDGTGAMRGRVCTIPRTDTYSNTCSPPDPMLPRACAISGSVQIDALPVTGHTQMDVEATFFDGSTVSIRL